MGTVIAAAAFVSFAVFIALICFDGVTDYSDAEIGDVFNEGGIDYQVVSEDGVRVNRLTGEVVEISLSTVVHNAKTYRVVSIGNFAFSNCTSLSAVTIGESITTIGLWAFENCSNLSSVTMRYGITTIGEGAFENCSNLTSLIIPDSVTSIGEGVFKRCSSLTSVTMSANITSISDSEFDGCSSLESFTIPDQVITIGDGAFWGCLSLTSLTFGTKVSSIGACAFRMCESLTSVTLPDSVTTIGNEAFRYCSNLSSINIPDGVSSINDRTFELCDNLTSITIPNSVTTIGAEAFYSCRGLTSITIPNSVITIGESAFSDCSGLISLTIPDSVKTIGNNAFSGCESLTSAVIGENVTSIGNSAFCGCICLTSLTLPDSLSSIGESAFSDCSGLTSLTIPDGVVSIGNYAFELCTGMTSVTIPNSVTTIGDGAFYTCWGLTSLTLPDSLSSIGDGAFWHCINLTSVTLSAGITSLSDNMFFDCYSLMSVTVPGSVLSIGDRAFWDCWELCISIEGDDPSAISLGEFAFGNNTGSSYVKRIYVLDVESCKEDADWSDYYNSGLLFQKISVPEARTDLVYNGTVQIGVPESANGGYTVTGNTGQRASAGYRAIVSPSAHYCWSGTAFEEETDDLEIGWSIAAAPLTIADTAVSARAYNGSTDVTSCVRMGTLSGIFEGDSVSIENVWTASIDNPDAGTDKAVMLSGVSIIGADAGNYVLTVPADLTIDISKKDLTDSMISVSGRYVYNGVSQSVSFSVSDGDPTIITAGDWTDDVGTQKSGVDSETYAIRIRATDSGNYAGTASAQWTIAAKTAVLEWSAPLSLIYDRTAKIPGVTVTNLEDGDSCSVTAALTAGTDNINVGLFTFSASALSNSNYALPDVKVSPIYEIAAKMITVSNGNTAITKTYDGTVDGTGLTLGIHYVFDGVLDGDSVDFVDNANRFNSKNVSEANSVTIQNLALDNANYIVESAVLSASISRSQIAVAGSAAADKVYDGNTAATIHLGTVTGIVLGEDVTVIPTGTFSDKNAEDGKTVTIVYGVSGDDIANYVAPVSDTVPASISKVHLTVSGSAAADKVYDGNTDAVITLGTVTGIVSGENVTVAPAGNFSDRNAAENKTVSIVYSVSGADAVNYLAPVSGTAEADIHKKALTDGMISVEGPYIYNGGLQTVTYSVRDGGYSFLIRLD